MMGSTLLHSLWRSWFLNCHVSHQLALQACLCRTGLSSALGQPPGAPSHAGNTRHFLELKVEKPPRVHVNKITLQLSLEAFHKRPWI